LESTGAGAGSSGGAPSERDCRLREAGIESTRRKSRGRSDIATERQIVANLRNGHRRPEDAVGKVRPNRSALKHGILSRELTEKGESAEEVAERIEALRPDLRPVEELKSALVHRIAGCIRRLLRCHEWEFDRMYYHMNDHVILAQRYCQELHMEWLPGQAFSMATNWRALTFRRLDCHEKAIEGRMGRSKSWSSLRQLREAERMAPTGPWVRRSEMASGRGREVRGETAQRWIARWAEKADAKLEATRFCGRLLTRAAVLLGEDVDDLAALVERLQEELAPEGELERWLLDRIAGSLWWLRRVYVIEAGLYKNQMLGFGHGRPKIGTHRPEIQGIPARAFGNECGNGVAVNQLHMYESAVVA
jgi:hypothetical protein